MTEQEYREDLIMRISRASAVVADLSNCDGFTKVVEDVQKQVDLLDNNWQLIIDNDEFVHKMRELRITKLASMYVINLIKNYEQTAETLRKELEGIDNQEASVVKDYDGK